MRDRVLAASTLGVVNQILAGCDEDGDSVGVGGELSFERLLLLMLLLDVRGIAKRLFLQHDISMIVITIF